MKSINILFVLVLFSTICSQIIEIENYQTFEIIFGDKSEIEIIYNFLVPESEIYEEAILIYKTEFDYSMYMTIIEEEEETSNYIGTRFYGYRLSYIKNKTISFIIKDIYGSDGKFTLLDLNK